MRPDSSIQWSAYPALLVAAAFATGILVESGVGTGRTVFWVAGVGLGSAGFAGAWWWERQRLVSLAPLGRLAAVVAIGLCAGGAALALQRDAGSSPLAEVADDTADEPLSVVGTVADAPERADSTLRFTLAVDSVRTGSVAVALGGRIRVTGRPSPWRETAAFPLVYQGDRLRLRGAVRRPPGQRNPGGFDYAAYLARRGICCVMYVGDGRQIAVRDRNRGVAGEIVVGTRRHLRTQIARYVPTADGRAVLRALLLGDRGRIEDAQRERFAVTGLMHLLAVSGLHVFLVGMVLYVLLRPLLMRFRLGWRVVEGGRAVLTVALLSLYMVLTGGRPSVVRAVIMSSLLIGGTLLQRSSHPLNTLGVAAVVLLALRPEALFDVGFQLSMAAVAAIVTVHPRLMEWVPNEWTASSAGEWVVSVTSVSAAATVGTAPVLLWHFGWVSVGGLLLNVFGIPCTAAALSAALGMAVVGGIWPWAGAAFGSGADLAVRGLLLTSRWGAEWLDWAGIRMGEPHPWALGALVCGAVALAQWPRPRHRWRCVICALLLLVAGTWIPIGTRSADPVVDILFFDVGQGDAALVTTPEGRRLLVDTGPRSPAGEAAVSFSVVPYLERRGIDRLDAVLVSHPDEDHLGGLPALVREVSVGTVLHGGQTAETDLYRKTRRLLRRRGISSRSVDRGDPVLNESVVRGRVLGPPARPGRHGLEGENDRSVVVRLAYGEVEILLPGDVEEDGERCLVRAYGRRLGSRVVKVPHHGSESSSTMPFVRRVAGSNTRAVVSVGRSNSFGMPSEEVLDRWKSEEARVRSTAQGGAVWLRSNGSEVWSVGWRE
jgi:competence protein ComEC